MRVQEGTVGRGPWVHGGSQNGCMCPCVITSECAARPDREPGECPVMGLGSASEGEAHRWA